MPPSETQAVTLTDRLAGLLIIGLSGLVIVREWADIDALLTWPVGLVVVALVGLLAFKVRRGGVIFILVSLALTAALLLTRDDGWQVVRIGLGSASFIGAFFAALLTLRTAASTSPGIRDCGRFLAAQPPGRRYAALTLGGQLFALPLNYGAIALLGGLAMTSAAEEPDKERRDHRVRRMLLAIQRGFISTLPWSPLSFAVAISVSVTPGASWRALVLPSLGTAALVAGTGWLLDTLFKPRLSKPAPAFGPVDGGWSSLAPLVVLLAVLALAIGGLHLETGVRIVGVVLLVVPVVSAAWIALQARKAYPFLELRRRAAAFATTDLASVRSELVLLMTAGYIGTTGSRLLGPMVEALGIDLAAWPTWVTLSAIVWFIPLMGQAGMNPILCVSLFAPLVPEASHLGVTPTAVAVALTAGWALSGITSPFTATTLLVGSFAKVSALHVGLRWNGVYAFVTALLLTGWVLLYAALN
ncbi:MAG: hypothetical protein ACPGNT_00565 [Rhodospirillales bacterium]